MFFVKKLACSVMCFAAMSAASVFAAGTLPSGYTEVEYIQGNGYVRITTDYTPNPTTDKAEAVVEWTNGTLTQNQTVWCARVGSGANNATWTLFLLNSSGYKFRFDYSSAAGNYLTPAVAADTKYTVTVDRNEITWSGGEGQTHTEVAGFTAAGSPLQLFASHQNGIDNSLNNWGKHKLYSFKVWRSGELIHYFVPCKDAKDVVTMYDICDNPATLTVKYAAAAPADSRVFTAGPEGHYYDDSFFNTDGLLDIQGSPADIGTPSPAYGLLSNLTAGQTESVSCGTPVVTNASENLEYTCIGWKLYDYDGNEDSSGSETSFVYTHPSPAEYRRLVWQWAVSSVKGTVTAGVGGSVAPSGTAWFAVNTPVTLTATPNAGKGFIKWSGDLPTGVSDMSASFTFTPTEPFELTASFGSAYYVATTGSDDNDGSEEHPFATVSNAVEKAAAAIDLNGGRAVINIAAGTYNESGLVLDKAISVIGASRDGVIINDGIVGQRAFTLSHDDAIVSTLTITNFGYRTNGGQGGHIRMTAGTVSNCVIKDGRVAPSRGYGNGGNVWMSGGRLERCYVVNGRANWGGWCGTAESYGMGLYASGGVVDSCFFKNNRDDNDNGRNRGSVYLNGAVTMVNCMVTGGYSRYGEACGIVINNASAKVVNCIAYGNYNTSSSTADSNFGNKNLGRYFYCASVITNASCAKWTVLKDEDFVNYRTYSPPTQRSPTFSDLQAYLTSEEYENFDWRLRLTSSAIDAGTTDTDYRPADCATLDLDGNARVSGSSIDLGCWEYDQSHLTCGAYLDGYGTLENGVLSFHATSAGASGAVLYRWDYGNGVTVETPNADHTYSYPAAGYYTARVQASSDGGTTWSNWYTVPTRVAVAPEVMYVDSNCATPAFPYRTRATAATTLGAAVGVLTNNVSENKTIIGGVEIVVLSGSRSNDTGMFLATPVTIRGESAEPADAEIVDDVVGSRAFTITHTDVVVSNLTISGKGIRTNGGQGGHIRMSAGLVANCVITNGHASAQKGYGDGGNIYMTGGRLERCLVTGGRAQWGGFPNHESCGMGLYATGGVIDSCFFKDNKTDSSDGQNSASVYLNGAVTMVNCMVTGGWSRNYNGKGSGIHINNASAKVVNCIAYGNYVVNKPYAYHTAAANIGSANYGRYFYCAAAFTNMSCATWKVLKDEDFVKYRTFSGTLLDELTAYLKSEEYAGFDWHPRLSSPLVEGGTTDPDYHPADGATLDLDGNLRVAGTSIDIGCWEYAQSQFTCGGSLSKYGALESEAVTFNGFAVGPSSDVVFRWDYGNGVAVDTREATHSYSYPSAGYFTVRIKASPDGGSTWTDWYTVPVRAAIAPMQMFVDSNCATPVFPYKTRATAANTLGAAVGALTNNISENKTVIDGVDIVVLKGSRSNDTGFFLATAVTVRGESSNPADAEIVDNVPGFRAFTITHPDVIVANLTISGNGFKTTGLNGGAGGHIWMSTGLVSNCAIKDGRAGGQKGYGNGGNVWMSGGRLERCLVSGGAANWGGFPSQPAYGLALYATGGVIDNCFFKDNKDYNANGRNYGGVCLDGAVTMLNSTVTGSWALDYGGVGLGIYIKNANAKVVNCVAYGNYAYYSNPARIVNNLTSNCGKTNLGRYFYCGAAFTNASCATWTVLTDDDFVKYKTFSGTTFADLDTYASSEEYSKFDLRQKRNSQLIDRGTLDTTYRPADSVTRDLDGNPRVLNRTIDLGCWEVESNVGFCIIVR
jgi:hypothetical protein